LGKELMMLTALSDDEFDKMMEKFAGSVVEDAGFDEDEFVITFADKTLLVIGVDDGMMIISRYEPVSKQMLN
jgi:phosphohistidine swiveling domain-containing protein